MSFEEDFLAHYGKKGMKWGQRRQQKAITSATKRSQNPYRYGNMNNPTIQRRVDVMKYVAAGKGVSLAYTKKGANKRLDKMRENQKAIKNGKKRVYDKYLRANGIDLREIKL